MDEMDAQLMQIDLAAEKNLLEKYANFYTLFDFWMTLLEEKKSIAQFFKDRSVGSVAIYGMGSIGKHFQKQLVDSGIHVKYTIDKGIVTCSQGHFSLDDLGSLEKVDAIIITPIMEYDAICEYLQKYIMTRFISAEEVILSM